MLSLASSYFVLPVGLEGSYFTFLHDINYNGVAYHVWVSKQSGWMTSPKKQTMVHKASSLVGLCVFIMAFNCYAYNSIIPFGGVIFNFVYILYSCINAYLCIMELKLICWKHFHPYIHCNIIRSTYVMEAVEVVTIS